MSCGGIIGGLAPEFAVRVELELAHRELQERLAVAPSREVLREENRRLAEALGRRVSYRETLARLLR